MIENISGRSMVEMLCVLVIVGVIGSFGLVAYSKAVERHRINSSISTVNEVVANTRNAFGYLNSRGYASLDFNVKSMSDKNYKNRKVADKIGLFPENIVHNDYKNIYGGIIQFFVDGMYKSDDGKAFILEFYSVPQDACVEFVTRDWNTSLGLIAMKVKGSADGYSIQSAALTGKCKTQYKKGVGLFCAADFPITLKQAVTVCDNAKNNNISWKFY